jgi:putative acetyltransferase
MASPRQKKRRKASLVIRAFEPQKDTEAVAEMRRLPGVIAGTLQLPHQSTAEVSERLKPSPNLRALVAELDGNVVAHGSVAIHSAMRRRHSAAIGLMVRDDFRGHGIGGELLDALVEVGERWLGVLRFELEVYVDNKAAIALYRSRGFAIEGVCRAFALRDGELVDAFTMAKVASTLPWPCVSAEDVAGRSPLQLPPGPDRGKN